MPSRYQDISVRRVLKRRIESVETQLRDPVASSALTNKDQIAAELQRDKARLEAITPPDTTPDEKRRIKERLDALSEAMVKGNEEVPGRPSEYEFERVPVGSVDKLLLHERFWKTHTLGPDNKTIVRVDPKQGQRGGIFEWKDLRRVLYKEEEEDRPNVANLDVLTPAHADVPLADTRLPRSYGLSAAAKARYDQVFPDHPPTPVEFKIKKGFSPEERERRRQRMKQYWEKKKAAAQQ